MKAEARVDTKGVEEALNKLTGPLKDRLLRSMLVASGKVPAQRLLDMYNGEWRGDIRQVYKQSF